MRNTIIKTTLAVLALSILAACGPSEQEKAEAKAIAINNAYQDMLIKSSERFVFIDGQPPSKEKQAELDRDAKMARDKWVELKSK